MSNRSSTKKNTTFKVSAPFVLSPEEKNRMINSLKDRFDTHMHRHGDAKWDKVENALAKATDNQLWSIYMMEKTGGEPDIVDLNTGESGVCFVDCSLQSPSGRRGMCYDHKAQQDRKKFPPENNAVSAALDMGISLLSEAEYHTLQACDDFDTTTSSWVKTPEEIRFQGGALFGDKHYKRVFIYHNGASSYYSSRGFRGYLCI